MKRQITSNYAMKHFSPQRGAGRHDIQHNGTLDDDSQPGDTQQDTQDSDTLQDAQHNDTQQSDTY